jgi:hypothetical protein
MEDHAWFVMDTKDCEQDSGSARALKSGELATEAGEAGAGDEKGKSDH